MQAPQNHSQQPVPESAAARQLIEAWDRAENTVRDSAMVAQIKDAWENGPLPDSTVTAMMGPSAQRFTLSADTTDALPIVKMLSAPEMESTWQPAAQPVARWETGMEGEPRTISIGDNSGVLTLIAVISLLMLLSFSHCKRLIGQLAHEIWAIRKRENAFDERTTGESRTMLLMAVQWCVCTGLLIYSAISIFDPASPLTPIHALADTSKLIGLCAIYYIFQIFTYNLVGYVFTTSVGRAQFVQGFSATQSLLGFALLVPALVSIFYPSACVEAVWVGAGLYVIARIAFIIKGFRIFYVNFGSLLYFILYLCTLEIVPVIIMAVAAMWLV